MARLSDEEMERLHAEDTAANTEWVDGGKSYIVHGFTEFGARRDPEPASMQGKGDSHSGPCAAKGGGAPRRRLAAARGFLRRVAMARLSDEEMERLHAEDTAANTEWVDGGKSYIVHGFTEFGARRGDQDGN